MYMRVEMLDANTSMKMRTELRPKVHVVRTNRRYVLSITGDAAKIICRFVKDPRRSNVETTSHVYLHQVLAHGETRQVVTRMARNLLRAVREGVPQNEGQNQCWWFICESSLLLADNLLSANDPGVGM